MDASFLLKLGLSFVIGSLWVTLTTQSAERFGSKVGGLIGGLPSTVVVALLFIGLTQSPEVAAQTTTVMPLAQGLNGLFVLTFMVFIRRGLWAGLSSAMFVWLVQSALLYLVKINVFWVSIVGWLALLAFCSLALVKWMNVRAFERMQVSYPAGQIIWRALFGGAVIALAVLSPNRVVACRVKPYRKLFTRWEAAVQVWLATIPHGCDQVRGWVVSGN